MEYLNNLGSFDTLDAVWKAYPSGCIEGDYVTVSNVRYGWNKYTNNWGDNTGGTTSANAESFFNGDVIIAKNLTVGGKAYIKEYINGKLFSTASALATSYPTPVVGQWALVGNTLVGSKVYKCVTAGSWADSGTTYSGVEVGLSDYYTKNESDALTGKGGFTDNTTINEYVKELYLWGLTGGVTYTACIPYITNTKLIFRLYSGDTVVSQVYSSKLTGGWYILNTITGVQGVVRMEIANTSTMPTSGGTVRGTVLTGKCILDNCPSLSSMILKSKKSPWLTGVSTALNWGWLNAVEMMAGMRKLELWMQDGGDCYFKGIAWVSSGTTYSLGLSLWRDGKLNVISLESGLTTFPTGVKQYKGEMACTVHNSDSTTTIKNAYLVAEIDFSVMEYHTTSISDDNTILPKLDYKPFYDSEWYETFYDVKNEQEQAFEFSHNLRENIIMDTSKGWPYLCTLENGKIVYKDRHFTNILALGNSITFHPGSTTWKGHGYGMASTIANTTIGEAKDYCSHLYNAFKSVDNNVTFERETCYQWERQLTLTAFDSYGIDFTGRDLIIIRLGENIDVANISILYDKIDELIAHIRGYNNTAKLIISGSAMCSYPMRQVGRIFRSYALENNITYVDVQCVESQLAKYGDWFQGFNGTNIITYQLTGPEIGHPNDLGMIHIANQILRELYYPKQRVTHKITVNSSLSYVCPTEWVTGGIFTLYCAGGTSITGLTDIDNMDDYYGFLMPDNDVTLTIN